MLSINNRDMAQLTPAERMRGNIERFIGETAGHVQLLASRNRHRVVRQAVDEEETDGEMQMYLDREDQDHE